MAAEKQGRLVAGLHCEEIAEYLSEFYDGELADDICRKIEAHVGGCEDCEVVFNTFSKTIELYRRESGNEGIPGDVSSRLHAVLKIDDLIEG